MEKSGDFNLFSNQPTQFFRTLPLDRLLIGAKIRQEFKLSNFYLL